MWYKDTTCTRGKSGGFGANHRYCQVPTDQTKIYLKDFNMFCSLCSSWEPCEKPGCWIAPGGAVHAHGQLSTQDVHAVSTVSTLPVHAETEVELDDEIIDAAERRRENKARYERERRARMRAHKHE